MWSAREGKIKISLKRGSMKIYTKKGDTGETSLFGGGPFPKDNVRIDAYGCVDELNSVLGCVSVELQEEEVQKILLNVQKELFIIGSELASLNPSSQMQSGFIQNKHTQVLENQIDVWEKNLAPLKNFILPGGSRASALLHLARTVCRRAERRVVTLSHQDEIRAEVLVYLNRLSDWLFVFARYLNNQEGQSDVLWEGIL